MPGGRPTKYSDQYPSVVKKLCLMGATDAQIADFFDVNVDTIHEWKIVYPEFSDALKTAKADFDELVEKSLLHRAIGYSYPEDQIFQFQGKPVIVPTVKHYPPSEVACIFWLKNRRPDRWRKDADLSPDGEDVSPVHVTVGVVDGRKSTSDNTASSVPCSPA